MIRVPLTLAFVFGLVLVVHFIGGWQFLDALKAIVASFGIFVLLAAWLAVRRSARNIGY